MKNHGRLQIVKNCFALAFVLLSIKAQAIVGFLPLTVSDQLKIQSHTVAVLNSQNPGNHSRCTGTLIAQDIVLTAAHCVPASLENFWVVTSVYEFAVSERKQVTKVIVNENYKSFDIPGVNNPNYDLALVKFAGGLPPVYKPTSYIDTFRPGTDRFWLYVAGYGISDEVKADSGELRISKVTIESALINAGQSFMQGNQAKGEGICKGDSGGPAYIRLQDEFYVIGVVSAIKGGCLGTSYFNQTLFYQTWIKENLTRLSTL